MKHANKDALKTGKGKMEVITLIEALKSREKGYIHKMHKMEDMQKMLDVLKGWNVRWKNLCINLQNSKVNMAQKIVEEQAVLVELSKSIEGLLFETSVTIEGSDVTSVKIDDPKKAREFLKVLREMQVALEENLKILHSEFVLNGRGVGKEKPNLRIVHTEPPL